MSKLTKGYGSGGMQAILGDIKTYYEGELAKKANTSDLGTASSRNATNQITAGSTALPEAGAVKTALDSKISTSNTPGHVMNDGTIDQTQYEKSGVAETLVKDTVGWSGKNKYIGSPSFDGYSNRNTYQLADETYNGHEVIYKNTTWSGAYKQTPVYANKTYTFSAMVKCSSNADVRIFNAVSEALASATIGVTWTKISATFTPTEDIIEQLRVETGTNGVTIYLSEYQLEENSSATSFEPYHATVDTVKADKVSNATAGNLASLDSNGNLTDSGVSPTEDVTVEGNPVTFVSPFEQDAKSIVVTAKPIQDLHGYDYPWVGGAGKNKLPLVLADIKANNTDGTWNGNVYSINGGTIEVLVNNAGNVLGFKANGTFTGTVSFSLYAKTGGSYPFESANYILNGCPQGGSGSTYKFDVIYRKNAGDYNLVVDYGASATADFSAISDADSVTARIVVYAGTYSNVIFYPMIRLATESDSTFAPYSNICPISGIDEVEIGVSGKNFFPDRVTDYVWGENASGTYEKSGDTIKVTTAANNAFSGAFSELGYVDADLSGVYTYSFDIKSNLQAAQAMVGFTGFGRKTVNITNEWQRVSITTTFNGTHGAFAVYSGDNTAKEIYIKNLQIESGSNSTPYEPYVSHTTTIPLPSTLYGFVAYVNEGKVRVTKVIHKVTSLNRNNDYSFFAGLPANTKGGQYYTSELLCDRTPIGANGGRNEVYVNDSGAFRLNTYNAFSTAEDALAYFGGEFNICYTLETPIELDITPAILELLEGTNVVTTNGEKVAVTYKAGILATLGDIDDLNDKVKTKFDKKDVAKVEGTNASKAYSVGDYMLLSDGFYRVTSSIASGAAITSNNTTKVTVGGELANKVNTDDSRLSDARTPVAHTHNISDITGIPAWTKLGEVTGTSPDYANSSTFNLSALQNKDVLMIFSVEEGTLTAKQGIITLEYSAFEFGKILENSVQEEDEITRLWKGFYGGAPRQSVATFEEFLRGLGYVYIATHSTTAEIGAKIYGAYDWTLEIYTK